MKLNFSKFKKVKSDKGSTTLKHPRGHTITIAHNSLTPKLRGELAALSTEKPQNYDGGGIAEAPTQNAADAQAGATKTGADYEAYHQSAEEQRANDQAKKSGQAYTDQYGVRHVKQLAKGGNVRRYADGTDDAQLPNPQPNASPDNQGMPDTQSQQAAPAQASIPPQQLQQASPQAAQSPGQSPSGDAGPSSDQSNDAEQEEGDDEDAQTSTSPQGAQPQVSPQPPTYQQAYQSFKDEHAKEYAQEDAAWDQDLKNGHITPHSIQEMFAQKDTLGKLGMIFGLMISGAGSALSHQPNVLLGIMNNQIQNDLKAQMTSKENARNFLTMTNQHELQKAQSGALNSQTSIAQYNLAKMKMNRAALSALTQQVNKLDPNSPQGQAAQQKLGLLYNSINNENFDLGDRAASAEAFAKVMGLSGSPTGGNDNEQSFQNKTSLLKSGMLGPQGIDRAKDMEAKHVPGFTGQASEDMTPTSKKELGSMVQYDQQLSRYTDWAKQHSGILPTTPQNIAIINQGKTLAKALQSTYREASLNTVYRPGEQGLLSQTIPDDPTKFLNKWRVIPQLDALRSENQAKLNIAGKLEGLGSYQGFNGKSPASQQPQQPAQQYKTFNGVRYMRGPKGEPIPIK